MDDGTEPDRGKDRAAAVGRATREQRINDFLILGIAAAIVLAGMIVFGAIAWWAAALAALILTVFAIAYFAGTARLEREAVRAAGDAVSDEERRRRTEAERVFRASLIDALPEPAMYIDPQGRVEAANAAARKQFRFPGAGPMLAAVVRRPELLDAVAATRRDRTTQRFEFVDRAETDRYFACVAAPLGAGVLVSMHDLTEIKRSEFARVDFLANASHELRTPLTSLAGFIETMRGSARNDPEAWDRFLEIMQGQADRMRRLISDLLSLSRIELVEHRPPEGEADLALVAKEAVDALLPVAKERQVSLRVAAPNGAINVTGVRDELTQVAQNLIDNAIKYSADGGAVEVEVLAGLTREEAGVQAGRRWEEAGHMSISTLPAGVGAGGRFAVLRVTDAGPGIERQFLPRLSERFYRVDPGRGLKPGTGLGLAIVKHVVQRHRGEFLVESETGRGSAFGVVLPMADEGGGVR